MKTARQAVGARCHSGRRGVGVAATGNLERPRLPCQGLWVRVAGLLLAFLVMLGGGAVWADNDKPLNGTPVLEQLQREGLTVNFFAQSAQEPDRHTLYQGEYLELAFEIRDQLQGEPQQALYPGVWIDLGQAWASDADSPVSCKQRVGLYLQGAVGIRPMVDLNSYFVLVMNREPSISVIDPLVGVTGITKLYARVVLRKPGADWAQLAERKRLFVSMPEAGEVAVVDTETFKVLENVAVGVWPTRLEAQPDGRYLWVADGSLQDEQSFVTVLDTASLQEVARIPLGRGHHEIAFSADSRFAFVSSRASGTVAIIDTQRLAPARVLQTGPQPIALAYSQLSGALYVADGRAGTVSVIDPQTQALVHTMTLQAGLGPLRFSEDGRWGVLLNTLENQVHLFDAATHQVLHTLPTDARPYQLGISRAFAYVRALGSEKVSMINLMELAKGNRPPVVKFQAGPTAPEKVQDISLADGMMRAPGEAAMLVVSPADNTVYYYMEGMNAPMGSFRNYGHRPRAVAVVDRTLKESPAGWYRAKVNLPEPGRYDVAFLLDSPRVLHCFSLEVAPNPALARGDLPDIEYLNHEPRVIAGQPYPYRFRLFRSLSGQPLEALPTASVRYYRAPGQQHGRALARHLGDGVYEAELHLKTPGAYYLYVGAPGDAISYDRFAFRTLMAVKASVPSRTERQPRSE